MRILIRPRLPVVALLLLAPAIPELLTGSTPVSEIVYNPVGFAVGFPLDIALYGAGALLIREFAVAFRKGWASILLLGAAYGIAEEGFEVHTFFAPVGTTVGALGSYGHLYGVNWLWALALTIFHATYSIALPILLTRLWFPSVKDERWFDGGSITLLAGLFLAEVVGFGSIVGHGPSPGALAFFVTLVGVLVALAVWAPRYLLTPVKGPPRLGSITLSCLGAVEFTAYFFVLVVSGGRLIPAEIAALVLVLADGGALWVLLRYVGTWDLERSEFQFAVGMLSVLFLWDFLIEFILVPGILVVTMVFVYLLYRLDRTLRARSAPSRIPSGARGVAPPLS